MWRRSWKSCRCAFTRSASGDRYMVMVKTLQARPSCDNRMLPGGTIMLKYTHDTHNTHTMPSVCANTFLCDWHAPKHTQTHARTHTQKQFKMNSNHFWISTACPNNLQLQPFITWLLFNKSPVKTLYKLFTKLWLYTTANQQINARYLFPPSLWHNGNRWGYKETAGRLQWN